MMITNRNYLKAIDAMKEETNYKNDFALFEKELSFIKNNHPCDNDTLHKIDQGIYNLDNKKLANLLTHEFYNPAVMHNVQCTMYNV